MRARLSSPRSRVGALASRLLAPRLLTSRLLAPRVLAAALGAAIAFGPSPAAAVADAGFVFFDPAARAAELARPDHAAARAACLAIPIDRRWDDIDPVAGLEPTEGYGSDGSAAPFAWAVMVLSGRALAGDGDATFVLKTLLGRWAAADALAGTTEVADAHYALKRVLLPTVVAYSIVRPAMDARDRTLVERWLGPLVGRVDKRFDGDVDHNNHRTLADSVLMAWGALVGDGALYAKGIQGFRATLAEARPDGSLPLEARRGARALWYTRHALASLTVMAEIARAHGDDLYDTVAEDRSFDLLLSFLTTGLESPILVQAYAPANHIPGPSEDYRNQDLGFLERRGNGRHYMAFAEAVARLPQTTAPRRLLAARLAGLYSERPLIDDYVGGNATCFFADE